MASLVSATGKISATNEVLIGSQVSGTISAVFVEENDNLTIEIRTKSANTEVWNTLKKSDRVIYAFTLSPEKIVTEYEHKTPSLKARLESIKMAQQKGHIVRLCFDPMIYTPDWKTHYLDMLDCVRSSVDMDELWDVSVGSFRVSQDYLKKMRIFQVIRIF